MNFEYSFQGNSGSPDAKDGEGVDHGRKKRPTESPSPESKTKQVRFEQDATSNDENMSPPKNRDVGNDAQKEGEHSVRTAIACNFFDIVCTRSIRT